MYEKKTKKKHECYQLLYFGYLKKNSFSLSREDSRLHSKWQSCKVQMTADCWQSSIGGVSMFSMWKKSCCSPNLRHFPLNWGSHTFISPWTLWVKVFCELRVDFASCELFFARWCASWFCELRVAPTLLCLTKLHNHLSTCLLSWIWIRFTFYGENMVSKWE